MPNRIARDGTCVCQEGFGDWMGQCVRLNGVSCYSDADCGGGVRSKCQGPLSKTTYRCDLTNNQCFPPVTVSCINEYGMGYRCENGNCVNT